MLMLLIFAQCFLVIGGICALTIAFGLWVSRRKYPPSDIPLERAEGFVMHGLALVGILFLLVGWKL